MTKLSDLLTVEYKDLVYSGISKAPKQVGVSYLGNTAHSTKLLHSLEAKEILTYGIYLAPADLSGYNVCQNSSTCKEHCLFGSGQTMMDIISGKNKIVNSRIKKTRLFFENKDFFMQWMIAEIKLAKLKAELDGMLFAVRINCTSDISISEFSFNGQNICEIFPDVQFYDYTKVYSNLEYVNKYPNYDLTYSYNGLNWGLCQSALKKNVRVAVVFSGKTLPKKYKGFEVINGDLYDARYLDAKNVIVGLKFKMVANNIKDRKHVIPKTPFVVNTEKDVNCEW